MVQKIFPCALVWVFLWSAVLFSLMGIDKHKARNGKYRIPERSLFLFALLGGAFGGWIGMLVFHHKTKHLYFKIFFPLLTFLWAAGLLYLRYVLCR